MGGSFDDAQMALHDAANACVCGGHVAEMEVSGLLDGGGLVEATTTIAELLVAEHCRCPDAHGYLQEALEELQRVLAGRQLVSQQPVGEEQQPDGFQVAVSAVDSLPALGVSRQQAPAGSRHHQPAGSR